MRERIMSENDTARIADDADIGNLFASNPANPTDIHRCRRYLGRSRTGLILSICWWSLVALPLDVGTCEDGMWTGLVVTARVIVIATGLAAVIEVRFADATFSFLCCVSVFAIAPQLPFGFQHSPERTLIQGIDCIGKTAFIFLICFDSLWEIRGNSRSPEYRLGTLSLPESDHATRRFRIVDQKETLSENGERSCDTRAEMHR